MKSVVFEEMRDEHVPVVLDIYTHYVLHSTATFHIHIPSMDEMRDMTIFADPRFRTYVIRANEQIIGYEFGQYLDVVVFQKILP